MHRFTMDVIVRSWRICKGVRVVKIERRQYEMTDLEIRTDGEGKPVKIAGYAARFDKLSVPLYGCSERNRKGAFTKSLQRNNVKALWNHNSDFPLGSMKNGTLKLEEDDKGLRFELELPDTTWGRDAAESIRRGDTDGMSFGFEVVKDEWDNSDPKNVIRTLVEVNLIEISPTPFPAYPSTSVSVRTAEEVYAEFVQANGSASEDEPVQEDRIKHLRRKLELAEKSI